MKIACRGCEKLLKQPGAILLSPPSGDQCFKLHLCKKCYNLILEAIDEFARA